MVPMILADIIRQKHDAPQGVKKIRISTATLRGIQDHIREREIEAAKKDDLGLRKSTIKLVDGGKYSSYEERAKALQANLVYAKTGDRLLGLEIVEDDSIPENTVKFE